MGHLAKGLPKSSKHLNTVEYATAVEHAINLAAETGAQYQDINVLFIEWKNDNDVEIPYFDIDDYRSRHKVCEACGEWQEQTDIHHIKTRGSGGTDNPSNILALCRLHHTQFHSGAPEDFSKEFGHLGPKIKNALGKNESENNER